MKEIPHGFFEQASDWEQSLLPHGTATKCLLFQTKFPSNHHHHGNEHLPSLLLILTLRNSHLPLRAITRHLNLTILPTFASPEIIQSFFCTSHFLAPIRHLKDLADRSLSLPNDGSEIDRRLEIVIVIDRKLRSLETLLVYEGEKEKEVKEDNLEEKGKDCHVTGVYSGAELIDAVSMLGYLVVEVDIDELDQVSPSFPSFFPTSFFPLLSFPLLSILNS